MKNRNVKNVKNELKELLELARISNDVLMIEGVHGIGKSEIIKEYADENDFHLKVLFTSLLEETDLAGIPVPKDNRTEWLEPDWISEMKEAKKNGKECVLFLDELNRANTATLNACLELLLNKEINGHKLPENTLVCAAINPSDTGDYQVTEFDPALLDRTLFYTLTPDPEAWVQWAKENNIHKTIINFIKMKPNYLHVSNSSESNELITPTPRSWSKLSDLIRNAEKMNMKDTLFTVIKGKVGQIIGSEFYRFYKETSEIVTAEDILDISSKFENTEDSLKEINTEAVEKIREVVSNTESVHLIDILENLNNDNSVQSRIALSRLFRSIPLETSTSFLKDLQGKDIEKYKEISMFEKNFNDNIFVQILTAKERK